MRHDTVLTRSNVSSLVGDVIALTPSYLVPGVASLITVPVLFNLLGASGYGLYALMYAIANGVPQLSTSWLEALILRFGHRSDGRAGWRAMLVAATGSAAGGMALAAVFVPGSGLPIALATGLMTLATGGYLVVIARLQSQLLFAAVSRTAAIRSVIGAVLAIAGASITGDAVVAILGLALGLGLGAAAGIRAARRGSGPIAVADAHAKPSGGDESLRYGLASAVFAVAQFVLSVGDRFILSAVRPLAEVGVYAATYAVIDLVFRFMPSIVITSIRQRLFRAWDGGDQRRAIAIFSAGFVLVVASMAWLIAGTSALGPGLRFLAVDPVLVGPIAAGIAAFIAGNVLVVMYSAQVRQVRVAAHVVLAAVVNIGLNLVLDPAIGGLGAALATAASYAVYLVANIAGLSGLIRADGQSRFILLAAAAVAGAGVALPYLGPVPLYVAAAALLAATPFVVRLVRSLVRPTE